MRLTIFSRLIIGYFSIFVLVVSVNVYAIKYLIQLEDVTHSILQVDNRLIEYEKKMTDSLISQVRYERKYIITKDKALYEQFITARNDFSQSLNQTMSITDSYNKNQILKRIKDYHKNYETLINEEVEYISSQKTYLQNWYMEEKEKNVAAIMSELKNLRAYTQQETYDKIKNLGESGSKARRAAIIITLMSFVFIIIISFIMTRSITKPLSVMKKKTQEIAGGNFDSNITISSPPEIKELSQAFNLMCKKLKEVDKIKSDFFSLMSHELRTPLTSIKEGINLLMEGRASETTPKQNRLLNIIKEESNRLLDMINSLLDLSKMEAGMMSYNFTESDISTLIKKAVFETEPLAESKNIRIEVIVSKKLNPVKMDKERILQVLRNLMANALKFTPKDGYIWVFANPVDGGVQVSVADTGPGLSKEDMQTVFDKFKQATMTNSNRLKGTGLGLAIVKHIINAHGGKIWVESAPGKGSIFFFVLQA
ncbi:MAG: HAMP domain-containing sensor histidine kinase [Nitrospirota bacterium]